MTVPTQQGDQKLVAAALPVSSCPSGWLCLWQHVYRNANEPGGGYSTTTTRVKEKCGPNLRAHCHHAMRDAWGQKPQGMQLPPADPSGALVAVDHPTRVRRGHLAGARIFFVN
jgi:hypothetical protein